MRIPDEYDDLPLDFFDDRDENCDGDFNGDADEAQSAQRVVSTFAELADYLRAEPAC